MATLVTGATGFIGSRLCNQLAQDGQQVIAFCRRKNTPLLDHPRIQIAIGDVTDIESIDRAIKGCDTCYHLAGLARQWSPDEAAFKRVNVVGTSNVVQSAIGNSLRKIVFTSTAGVFGPSVEAGFIDEQSRIPESHPTAYESTKREAERIVLEHCASGRIEACIACPTRTFGPGPLTEANSVTQIMQRYESGKWRWVPGNGKAIGNYVFVDDVVRGLILAMDKGSSGSRYILGGENLSFEQVFALIKQHSSRQHNLIPIPRAAILAYSWCQSLLARTFGRRPRLTLEFASRYFCDYLIRFPKTKAELGYDPRSLDDGVCQTMEWLRQEANGANDGK